jgi:type I restriction enzyme S subunit
MGKCLLLSPDKRVEIPIHYELQLPPPEYNYYRDQLLSLDEGEVTWKALGEVIKLQRGKRLIKSQLETSGNYAVYQNSMTPLGYYHESNVKSDTAFIISAGAAIFLGCLGRGWGF